MGNMVFSVEDIHRLRYEHYEKIKNSSPEEWIAMTNANAQEALYKMAALNNRNDSREYPIDPQAISK